MNEVHLHVEDIDTFFAKAVDMARGLDAGRLSAHGHAEIAFENMDVLLKVLTPNRWRLMQVTGGTGRMSIKALAAALRRDYRGVHADVTALLAVGLMARDRDNLVYVPWSKVTAEMRFEAAA